MRVHGSAKTNVYQRRLLIRRVRQQGWTQRQAAEALGVSVRTVAKWLARDRTALGGSVVATAAPAASHERRRPKRRSSRCDAPARPPGKSVRRCGVPRSTVTRVLARAGLNRVALVEPSGPVQRYEWPHVGDLLHIDLKRLGRVVGHRPSHSRRSAAAEPQGRLRVSACGHR